MSNNSAVLAVLLTHKQHSSVKRTCLPQWILVIVLSESHLWRWRPLRCRRRMLLQWTVLCWPKIHQTSQWRLYYC